VDAAYALHNDSKSHTGVVIYVGETLVYVSSKKQKCMSKSPTEAELIALTDNLGLIELFHEFLEFLTMKRVDPPTIYQDCNAVVSLDTKGGGQTRTKHLRARMNLGKEMVDERRAEVKHICAEKMELSKSQKRVVRYDGREKGQHLSDESEVEESVKIRQFKTRDIKKETVFV